MESDDEYDLFSLPEKNPSPVPPTKFKRLKKAVRVSSEKISHEEETGFGVSSEKSPHEEQTGVVSAVDSLHGVHIESSKTQGIETSVDRMPVAFELEGLDYRRDLDSVSWGGINIESLKNLDFGVAVDPTLVALEHEGHDEQMDDYSGNLRAYDSGEGPELGVLDAETEEFSGKGDERNTGEEIRGEMLLELNEAKNLKKRHSKNGSEEKKTKKAKKVGDDGKPEASARTKRRLEKERYAELGALHAESQRVLRETRNASFKPVPIVHKPISSILEKIRQRKLEVSKKACNLNSYDVLTDATDIPRDSSMGPNTKCATGDKGDRRVNVESLDADHVSRSVDHVTISSQSEHVLNDVSTAVHLTSAEGILDSGHVSKELPTPSGQCEDALHKAAFDEASMHAFRPPVNDTQDLFSESQPSEGDDEQPMSQSAGPLEEFLVSSMVPMNLKLDSVPDISDDDDDDDDDDDEDDEDDNKENVEPYPRNQVTVCSSPKGDPVKAFVDEEAEVEYDSDNDLMRFQENEEDGENGDEELDDLIARGYREKPIDGEMRNQLHQKWLERQDATETDNLLQRLKGGWKQRESTMLEDEEEDEEFGEDSLDGAPDDLFPSNVAKANSKKFKQIIPELFTDKDDVFLSDDEETEQSLHKQRLLEKIEDQASLLSPAEDESSREVFGLIKKLNIAPETKRKPKLSSFLDTLVTGGNRNNSSKSSFLGRAPSFSSSSSNKHGSSTSRSFIFGRDDSNSRSGISSSEVSSDIGLKEKQATKNAFAKYTGSQSKSSTQNTRTVTETESSSSLFQILRRSMESDQYSRNNLDGQTQTVFAAFKSEKKAIKVERRRT